MRADPILGKGNKTQGNMQRFAARTLGMADELTRRFSIGALEYSSFQVNFIFSYRKPLLRSSFLLN